MDLIENHKNSLDTLLDYFTCNLRPSSFPHDSGYHTIIDKTDKPWKLYVNDKWHEIFTRDLRPTSRLTGEISFYVRKNSCERYYTNNYTLYAVRNLINGIAIYTYYIFDNSKLVKDGET